MTDQNTQDSVLDSLPDELPEIANELSAHFGTEATEPIETKSIVRILGALQALGYQVRSATEDQATKDVEWSGQEGPSADLESTRSEAEKILRTGEPLLAFNLADRALIEWKGDLRLRQLAGLALARAGAVDRANKIFKELAEEGHDDGETLGILGRTHKDLAIRARDPGTREAHLDAAYRSYEKAYLAAQERGNAGEIYYTGINAATVAVLLGDAQRSFRIASHVHEICSRELDEKGESSGGDYWLRATLGEASLIEGRVGEAREHYRKAAELAGLRFGDLASTRRQARLLLRALDQDPAALDSVLNVPPVLVYSGHMIDTPDRSEPRFPPSLESTVAGEIRERLDRIRPAAAYGSAACGADILVLEAMLERQGEIHVILPFPPEAFKAASVDIVPDGRWGERFDRVLEMASSVTVASDHHAKDSDSTFHYANQILSGMAELRCRNLETELIPLVVWDGAPAGGAGGTASLVEPWRRRGHEIEHIDVRRLVGLDPLPPLVETATIQADRHDVYDEPFAHVIRSLLFADATGYSKLTENQIPLFVEHFMGAIAKITRECENPPLLMETAGDGLYYVFADPSSAGEFALALSALVNRTDWSYYGLPEGLNMRVALHCGPVYTCIDPVTELRKYTGPHTSRTARIEPITPPGHVYASSGFAAVAAAEGVKNLHFDYIGHTSLAKKYGSLALYHMRRPD